MDEYIDTSKVLRIKDEVLTEMRKHPMLATRIDNNIYPFDDGIRGHPFYQQIKTKKDGSYTSIIDLGCGAGTAERQLILSGMKKENVRGLDKNPRRFELGFRVYQDKDDMKNNFIAGDALSPDPSLFNSFDYSYSSYLIHLLGQRESVIRFLGTAFSVLKKDGIFFGRLPENGRDINISPDTLIEYFYEAGFENTHVEKRNHNGREIIYFYTHRLSNANTSSIIPVPPLP